MTIMLSGNFIKVRNRQNCFIAKDKNKGLGYYPFSAKGGVSLTYDPAGKIAEKAGWRSAFWTI